MINDAADTTDIERVRRAIGRAGFIAAAAAMSIGIALFVLGQPVWSGYLMQAAFGVLLAMPVKNVAAVLADEVRRRDWWFAALAVGVLAEIAYTVFDRLR